MSINQRHSSYMKNTGYTPASEFSDDDDLLLNNQEELYGHNNSSSDDEIHHVHMKNNRGGSGGKASNGGGTVMAKNGTVMKQGGGSSVVKPLLIGTAVGAAAGTIGGLYLGKYLTEKSAGAAAGTAVKADGVEKQDANGGAAVKAVGPVEKKDGPGGDIAEKKDGPGGDIVEKKENADIVEKKDDDHVNISGTTDDDHVVTTDDTLCLPPCFPREDTTEEQQTFPNSSMDWDLKEWHKKTEQFKVESQLLVEEFKSWLASIKQQTKALKTETPLQKYKGPEIWADSSAFKNRDIVPASSAMTPTVSASPTVADTDSAVTAGPHPGVRHPTESHADIATMETTIESQWDGRVSTLETELEQLTKKLDNGQQPTQTQWIGLEEMFANVESKINQHLTTLADNADKYARLGIYWAGNLVDQPCTMKRLLKKISQQAEGQQDSLEKAFHTNSDEAVRKLDHAKFDAAAKWGFGLSWEQEKKRQMKKFGHLTGRVMDGELDYYSPRLHHVKEARLGAGKEFALTQTKKQVLEEYVRKIALKSANEREYMASPSPAPLAPPKKCSVEGVDSSLADWEKEANTSHNFPDGKSVGSELREWEKNVNEEFFSDSRKREQEDREAWVYWTNSGSDKKEEADSDKAHKEWKKALERERERREQEEKNGGENRRREEPRVQPM